MQQTDSKETTTTSLVKKTTSPVKRAGRVPWGPGSATVITGDS